MPAIDSVLIFTNLYPTPGDPQRGVFIAQLARAMALRCRVTVVCPLPKLPHASWLRSLFSAAPPDENLPDKRRDGDIDVYYLRYPLLPKISDYIHGWLIFWSCRRALRRIMHACKAQAVLGQWIYPDGFAAALILRRQRIPLVLTALGSDINRDLRRPLIGVQIRWALQRAVHVVTVSRALRERLAGAGVPAQRLSYVPTGVDQVRFHPRARDDCRRQLGLPQATRIVIVIGRLVPVKDHDTFIRGFARLVADTRRATPIAAYIIGDGPLRASLEHVAMTTGAVADVHFIGARPHEELPLWLGACDALCLSSINEGQPNVILESLASGRPVVASAVGGIPDLVNRTNGALFVAGDSAQLAARLAEVLAQSWDAAAIRATIAVHRFEDQAQAYLSILNSDQLV